MSPDLGLPGLLALLGVVAFGAVVPVVPTGAAVSAAAVLARAGDLTAVQSAPAGGRVDAVAHLLGIPVLSDRTRAELTTHTADPQRLVAMALVAPENLVT